MRASPPKEVRNPCWTVTLCCIDLCEQADRFWLASLGGRLRGERGSR